MLSSSHIVRPLPIQKREFTLCNLYDAALGVRRRDKSPQSTTFTTNSPRPVLQFLPSWTDVSAIPIPNDIMLALRFLRINSDSSNFKFNGEAVAQWYHQVTKIPDKLVGWYGVHEGIALGRRGQTEHALVPLCRLRS